MNVQVSASVFSVVTQRAGLRPHVDLRDELQAYLYAHTEIIEEFAGLGEGGYVYYIVKTTATDIIDSETRRSAQSSQRDLVQEAFYLANYQLDRLSSGLIGGILAGSKSEAERLLGETVR